MFNLSSDDLALFGPHLKHAANCRVIPLGTAAGENHLHRIGGADQTCDLYSGFAKALADLAAETMDARRVAVELRIIRGHSLKDLRQYPRRGVVIEVDLGRHHSHKGILSANAAFQADAQKLLSFNRKLHRQFAEHLFAKSTDDQIDGILRRDTALPAVKKLIFADF